MEKRVVFVRIVNHANMVIYGSSTTRTRKLLQKMGIPKLYQSVSKVYDFVRPATLNAQIFRQVPVQVRNYRSDYALALLYLNSKPTKKKNALRQERYEVFQ